MGDPEAVRGDVYETGWLPKSNWISTATLVLAEMVYHSVNWEFPPGGLQPET